MTRRSGDWISRQTGQANLDGWVLNYNLFREHESLRDRTPAEAARMNPPFSSWGEAAERTSLKRVVPKVEVVAVPPTGAVGKGPKVVVNEKILEDLKAKPKQAKQGERLRRTAKHHPFMRRSERRRR